MLIAREQQQVWGRRSLPVACPPPVERQATKSDGLPHVVTSCPFNCARLYSDILYTTGVGITFAREAASRPRRPLPGSQVVAVHQNLRGVLSEALPP
jgi:hypothetical protein